MRAFFRLTLFAIAVMVAACGDFLSRVCAGVGLPAVAVTVFDAQSGARAAAGASLILHSAGCTDSVAGVTNDQVLVGCWDHEGTYDVTVRKAGYRDWVQTGVRVRDTCSLDTRRFDARLERLP
jgi:hypothetical protein